MIDLDNLERTLELANDYVDDGLHFLTEPVSYGELKLLAERLISAEKDAARYRWLRDSGVENLFSYQQDMRSRYWDEDIDAEIEAIQCNK